MTSVIAITVLAIYTLALFYITVYCLMQFDLLYHYKKHQRDAQPLPASGQENGRVHARELAVAASANHKHANARRQQAGVGLLLAAEEEGPEYPFVTVQLPIYNEMYVVERLIDNIACFDYPQDRFEIHILDDSTDETVDIVRQKVQEYKAKGLQIEQIRREKRQGFKAGALRDGMAYANGEFLAIFDADFLPNADFLKQTIPHFEDDNVGVVQTRWEHINRDYSLITKLQALQLNVHFTVEQVGRMAGDYMLQFNGTAGVWRRETIDDAGGWEADTLTEDFDLSIRAQLRGWKIKYLEEVSSPAELPAEMNAFKSQQFRWMKGGAETARKMLPTVWQSPALSLRQKVHATSHLLASTIFVFVFLTGLFSVPLLFSLGELIEMGFSKNFFAYFLAGLLSIIAVYYAANVQAPTHNEPFGKALVRFLVLFPLFLALSMGLSLHNTVAVVQGYMGRKSPFVRTPKFNIQRIGDNFQKRNYLNKKLSWTTLFEGVLALYFAGAVIGGLLIQNTTFVAFHLMLAVGYGAIFFYTVRHLSLR